MSDQEGYGKIFSRAARLQSLEYLNFWRLVSSRLKYVRNDSKSVYFLIEKKGGAILQVGSVE